MLGLIERCGIAGWLAFWIASGPTTLPAEETNAQNLAHPVVPGFERFQGQEQPAGLDHGRLLLGELNCVSCHQAEQAAALGIHTKQAPILDDVGARVRVEYLREFLQNPQHAKPGTTMPNLLASFPEAERVQTVEALVHFLAMTGSVIEQPADPKKIDKGEKLFHEVGCTACHAPQDGTKLTDADSIPLGDLSKKYSVPSLTQFLMDPLKVRPSARMPAPNLKKNEVEEVVSYLLKDLAGAQGTLAPEIASLPKIPFRYYEGSWSNLPDFEKLKPVKSAIGPAFSASVSPRNDNFGLVFDAWFLAPSNASYTFEITSDDGSEILVDGKRVAINDGLHPASAIQGKVELAKGPHQVMLRFFQGGGDVELGTRVAGPAIPLQPLGPLVAASKEDLLKLPVKEIPQENETPRFVIKPELVKQGRALFSFLSCASCHQLKENGKAIQTVEATRLLGKPLTELTGNGGCLDSIPRAHLPTYSLSKPQRETLAGTLKNIQSKKPALADAEGQIASTMARFNCYACHERNKIGGVTDSRNALFLTTQKEMGDEGRIPPALDGVGAKLTANWLKKIFREGSQDRPYMLTRMPKFGEKNVGHLQMLLEGLDEIETVEIPAIDLPIRRIKSEGRMMSGDEVFGCIKCHTFKGQQALGIQSIDMAIMTQRLKHDWFHRYLVKPSAFRPGTRMPTAWPQGRSTLRDVLEGDTHKQIEAIWQYLSDGGNARAPQDLNRQAIVLEAGKDALIYRNFIEGAGPRAIGVAYPEKVNLAFDANEMRLALIWQNRFIDASKHWVGRGPGYQVPLGDQVLKLANGPAFARLEKADAAWPNQPAKETGYKFRGYELTPDNRPTFLYDFGDTQIKDFPSGVATEPYLTLKRTLTLKNTSQAEDNIYFRALVGSAIEEIAGNTYRVNKDYQVRIQSDADPVLVEINGQWELRVPIKWNTGQAKIVQEILW